MGDLYDKLSVGHKQEVDIALSRFIKKYYDLNVTELAKDIVDLHRENLVQSVCGIKNIQEPIELKVVDTPIVAEEKFVSSTEIMIQEMLKTDFKIPFEFDKQFKNDRVVGRLKFDFVLDNGFIIEYDGEQHFETVQEFKERNGHTVDKGIKNDNLKNIYCLEQGIPFLRIPYIYTMSKRTKKQYVHELIQYFLLKRRIYSEIIEFYADYLPFNNYAEVAKKLNKALAT